MIGRGEARPRTESCSSMADVCVRKDMRRRRDRRAHDEGWKRDGI